MPNLNTKTRKFKRTKPAANAEISMLGEKMHYILLTLTVLIMFLILSSEDAQPAGVVKVKKRYHKNDVIKEEIPYNAKGQIHGIYRYYHNNGYLQMKVLFKNGAPNGLCQKYDKRGRLVKEITYKNGNITKEKDIAVVAAYG